MSTLQRLKETHLLYRKEKASDKATLLSTIIGEAEMIGKSNGNRESTEEEVVKVLRRFEKNMLDNAALFKQKQMIPQLQSVVEELSIVRHFLPVSLSDTQVQEDIVKLMLSLELPKEQKSQGIVVKELKVKYGHSYDGKQVSEQFKILLGGHP